MYRCVHNKKDQSGRVVGYIIVIAQVTRDLWLLVNKPRARAMPSDSVCLLPQNPGTVNIPPSIVLPMQQVGIISLPEGYKGNYGS